MQTLKRNIKDIDSSELINFLTTNNFEKFRERQVHNWVWRKNIRDFSEMKNIPKPLILLLEENFKLTNINIHSTQVSGDKTVKVGFKSEDNKFTEGVIIPAENRLTACISSQTGCPLKCLFCASGTIEDHRNLSTVEIFEQISELNELAKKSFNKKLTNIVLMGIGEPFLNYDNVINAIKILIKEWHWSPGRITISTAGLIEGIRQLSHENLGIKLAISLHTANPEKRNYLMPVNKSNPLQKLKETISTFNKHSKKTVTLEYLLLKDFNDNLYDAKLLTTFCKGLQVKINLIEYNPIKNSRFLKSEQKQIMSFMEYLSKNHIPVTLRKSKGGDIDAACGQLVNNYNPDNLSVTERLKKIPRYYT